MVAPLSALFSSPAAETECQGMVTGESRVRTTPIAVSADRMLLGRSSGWLGFPWGGPA